MMSRAPLNESRKAPGYRLVAHAAPQLLAALDMWIARQPEPRPTRSEAVKLILEDWLVGQGLLKHREDPEGANGQM